MRGLRLVLNGIYSLLGVRVLVIWSPPTSELLIASLFHSGPRTGKE